MALPATTPFTHALFPGQPRRADLAICATIKNRRYIRTHRSYPSGQLISEVKYDKEDQCPTYYFPQPDGVVRIQYYLDEETGICDLDEVTHCVTNRDASKQIMHKVDGPALYNPDECFYYIILGHVWKSIERGRLMSTMYLNQRDLFGRPLQHDTALPSYVEYGSMMGWTLYSNPSRRYRRGYRRDGPSDFIQENQSYDEQDGTPSYDSD